MAKKDDKFFTQSVDVSIPSQNIEIEKYEGENR